MQREIKFRGKSLAGKWVYGYLFEDEFESWILKPLKVRILSTVDEPEHWEEELSWINVDPKTVGQFIGVPDKNGKDAYEGDVIQSINGFDVYPGHQANGLIYWDRARSSFGIVGFLFGTESHPFYMPTKLIWQSTCDGRLRDEIIGNHHDNPELLKNPELLEVKNAMQK